MIRFLQALLVSICIHALLAAALAVYLESATIPELPRIDLSAVELSIAEEDSYAAQPAMLPKPAPEPPPNPDAEAPPSPTPAPEPPPNPDAEAPPSPPRLFPRRFRRELMPLHAQLQTFARRIRKARDCGGSMAMSSFI